MNHNSLTRRIENTFPLFTLIVFMTVMTGLSATHGQNQPVAGPDAHAVVMDALQKVARTSAPDPTDSDELGDPASDREEKNGDVIVKSHQRMRKVADRLATLYVNKPNIVNQIYPGALLWWDTARAGNFDPVPTQPGKPFTFVIRQATFTGKSGGPARSTFETDGSAGAYQNVFSSSKVANHGTAIDYEIVSSRSLHESMLKLGMSANYLTFASGSASIDSVEKQKHSSYVLCLKQSFFTVGIDSGKLDSGGPLLLRTITQQGANTLAQQIDQRDTEIAYVSDVNYGRMAMLLISSDETEERLKTAVEASASFFGSGGSANLSKGDHDVMANASIRCIFVGNILKESELAPVLTSNFDTIAGKVKEYLSKDLKLDDPMGAVPISFTIRYARDLATAMISESVEYAYWKPFEMTQVGATGTFRKDLVCKPPGAINRGDSEMDVGDSGARIWINYQAELTPEKNGLIVTVTMREHEFSNSFARKKDTEMSLVRTFTYRDIVPRGRTLEIRPADLRGGGSREYTGYVERQYQPFPNFARASNVSVIFDHDGDGDNGVMSCKLSLAIPYKVADKVMSVP